MVNVLGAYNPVFYAQEALDYLRKSLGMASRVHLGFDAERRAFGKGDTITIRRPSVFTAQAAPSSAQAVNTETVSMTLDQYWEVKYELTDKEKAFTGEQIVQEHIAPAAYAIADKIDSTLVALSTTVPHAYVELAPGTATAATILGITSGVWRQMFDNKVQMKDTARLHFMLGGKEWTDLVQLSGFSQWQGAGQMGVDTQVSAMLGQRYGFNFFPNQNRTTLAYANITDFAGAGPTAAKGATSLAVTGLGTAETYSKGMILKFTSGAESGNQYALTADALMSGGGGTFVVNPGLRVGATSGDTFAIGDVVALKEPGTAGTSAQDNFTNSVNLAFHRDWAALAFAKLPDYNEYPNQLGASIASIQDPVTGLAVRYRVFYDGNNSKMYAAVDALWSVKELQPEFACRYEVLNT